jgi:Reverse transcriptase (RNA-dependent DNA polymerase)
LNLHGGQQEFGVNYWETYAPVVTWAAIRLILALVLIHKWHTRQIDFVLAYPQADVECDLYMKIPKGFTIQGHDQSTHVLKLLKNLYGQRQAGRVWNKLLHNNFLELR